MKSKKKIRDIVAKDVYGKFFSRLENYQKNIIIDYIEYVGTMLIIEHPEMIEVTFLPILRKIQKEKHEIEKK